MKCGVVVYSYRPRGASTQRRFAVATGNRPSDLVSTHGTQKTAIRAAGKLAKVLGCSVEVDH